MKNYSLQKFPRSRIATFDVYSVSHMKHHISILLECDVTDARKKIKEVKSKGNKISFNSWLLKVISTNIKNHSEAAAFLLNKRKLIIFDDINISTVVEKEIEGTKVPIPLVIEKTSEKDIEHIFDEIENAKKTVLSEKDIVLNKKSTRFERLYYHLPGFIRRRIWKTLLRKPKAAYKKMGNVVVTALGMMGQVNGWFIHKSVHPISFGIGSIIKKPWVIDNEIKIREILNMTVLIDHDVIDGAPMARFIKDLVSSIENADDIK